MRKANNLSIEERVYRYPDDREGFIALCVARAYLRVKGKYPPYYFTRLKRRMIAEGYITARFCPTEKGVELLKRIARYK